MAFYSREELELLGFKKLGKNISISKKASLYHTDAMEIGDNSRIDDFCLITGKVVLGRNVHIAPYCNVDGGDKGIYFGDFSGLAYACHAITRSDDYSGDSLTNPTVPNEFKTIINKKICIGKHGILGAMSIILPGITIGEGSSVGANSLITKDTEDWTMYFGSPAKKIKKRSQKLLLDESLYLKHEKEQELLEK